MKPLSPAIDGIRLTTPRNWNFRFSRIALIGLGTPALYTYFAF